VAQIQFSLRVPPDAIADVVARSKGVVTEQDFYKEHQYAPTGNGRRPAT